MADMDQELELITKDKPWLHPDLPAESWWIVTSEDNAAWVLSSFGHPPIKTTLINCLCVVGYETGSAMFAGLNGVFVNPGKVAHAYQVLLVRADDPHRAAYGYDQVDVDEAFRRSS
ncbi:hypothetical protein [Brevibacterium sp.]|uniref:hypothetical protein n=1 Tax=Brevibacterium sp. TaxID=1701 RepID=UPI002811A152|nr:hypothetical protein [Brevibacterium sp.]